MMDRNGLQDWDESESGALGLDLCLTGWRGVYLLGLKVSWRVGFLFFYFFLFLFFIFIFFIFLPFLPFLPDRVGEASPTFVLECVPLVPFFAFFPLL